MISYDALWLAPLLQPKSLEFEYCVAQRAVLIIIMSRLREELRELVLACVGERGDIR